MIVQCCYLMLRLAAIVALSVGLALTLGVLAMSAAYGDPVIPLTIGAMLLACLRYWRAGGAAVTTHGSARVSAYAELVKGGLLSRRGLVLGRVFDGQKATPAAAVLALLSPAVPSNVAVRLFLSAFVSRWLAGNEMLRLDRFVHGAIFAPAGKGKSVSILLPILLSYLGNLVCVDPKGELFRICCWFRTRVLGFAIYRFDPFGVCDGCLPGLPPAATLNPLSVIRPGDPELVEKCRGLANAMVIRQAGEKETYWNDAAENVIAIMLIFICVFEKEESHRNLQMLRELVSDTRHYVRVLQVMTCSQRLDGLMRRFGGQLQWLKDRELGSVMSNVQRQTAWLDSPKVAASMQETSFDLRLLRSNRRYALHLILPAASLVTLAAMQRLWLATVLNVTTEGVPTERNPLLFLVDEAAHIGRVKALEDAISLKRGMGIRVFLFFQSIAQMRTTFGEKSEEIYENLDTRMFFGVNSFETADLVSRTIGEKSQEVVSINETRSRSRPVIGWLDWFLQRDQPVPPDTETASTSTTVSHIARRLIRPEEVLTLESDISLIFHRNLPVVIGRLIRHFDDRAFAKIFDGRRRRHRPHSLVVVGVVMLAAYLFGDRIKGSYMTWLMRLTPPPWAVAPPPPPSPDENDAPIDATGEHLPVVQMKILSWDLSKPPSVEERIADEIKRLEGEIAALLDQRQRLIRAYRLDEAGEVAVKIAVNRIELEEWQNPAKLAPFLRSAGRGGLR